VYHTRYYRRNPASGLSLFGILALRELLDGLVVIGFPGDHDTYGLGLFVADDDDDLAVARHDWAWNALLAGIPRIAPWIDPGTGTALTSVQTMTGHQNIRRHFVVGGQPLVRGLLAAGDSLCTTNPIYGWGASMALTYAFAAVEAATDHTTDPDAMALAYDAATAAEADGVYRESAAMDRIRRYQWRGDPVPDWDRAEVERQDLIMCVAAGALRDPVLGRAQLRRMHLLEPPDAVLDDPLVVERARHTQAILAAKGPRPAALSRDEIVGLLKAAAPR
jgi:hypothetical protein